MNKNHPAAEAGRLPARPAAVNGDLSALATLTGEDRTAFKRTVLKPAIHNLQDRGWVLAEIVAFFAAALPRLDPDERAEVVAAIVAKGE